MAGCISNEASDAQPATKKILGPRYSTGPKVGVGYGVLARCDQADISVTNAGKTRDESNSRAMRLFTTLWLRGGRR